MATEKKDSDLPSEFIWGSHMLMGIFFYLCRVFRVNEKKFTNLCASHRRGFRRVGLSLSFTFMV